LNKNLWLFIDIDGCVMHNIFNNSFYTNDTEKIESIINTYKNARDVEVYSEFVEWFKRITESKEYDIEDITFITGRQENCFGWLTDIQLRPLEKYHWFDVHYFYNHSKHTWELYKSFKVHCVLDALQYSNYRGQIKIYDDYDFSKELKEVLDMDFEFYVIKEKEDWNGRKR